MPAYSNKCILHRCFKKLNSADPLNSLEAASVDSCLSCFMLFSILNAYLGVVHTGTYNQWCSLSQLHSGLLRNAKALKWWSGAHLCDQCAVSGMWYRSLSERPNYPLLHILSIFHIAAKVDFSKCKPDPLVSTLSCLWNVTPTRAHLLYFPHGSYIIHAVCSHVWHQSLPTWMSAPWREPLLVPLVSPGQGTVLGTE